jgi:2-hydroxy fatty acid dioxygenase
MTANFFALAGFLGCWIAQFLGHGVFEGRAPALLDNIFQAFFLAPLFVWLEILFALGYRPELKSRIEKLVKSDVEKFQAEKKAAKINGNGVHANGNGNAVNGHAKAS